ncbi:hypothetical protein FE251_09585 [Georgenia wutianyii]|uniref:Uncharacterized protein n=1 Tax=Georgenia wutianyii TaxID=2585135 RepID=A0ABX5VRY5_9MICO|nr:hypothetical protein [Georgenia wutianyii]QDB79595.1 hypothetical protein FE251_09585 [Georgenia wutianyii]
MALQPTEEQREVGELFAEVEDANIWVGAEPVMFSDEFIVEHFDAFDYEEWHSWEELPASEVAGLPDLVTQAAGYAGKGVVSLGRVVAAQPMGGIDWLVQIGPLSDEVASQTATRDATISIVGEDSAIELLSHAVPDPDEALSLVYCRTTLPPLRHLQEEETVLFKGTPVAYGQTLRNDNRLSRVNYMLCSSIERFFDGGE